MTDPTLFTVPAVLKPREQHVYQLTEHGPVTATVAGISWHIHRDQWCSCSPDRPCQYASMDGSKILEQLRHKGLLKRDRHRNYRRTYEPSSQGDDIGF